jgi:hypothetical protein
MASPSTSTPPIATTPIVENGNPREFYQNRIAQYSEQSRLIQNRLALISTMRLVSFTAMAITVWFITKGFTLSYLFICLFFLAAFIALVLLALRLKDRRALLERLLFVNTNELGVLDNAANGFPDGGSHLSSESYLDDLDIFGKRSLFHLLNRTTASHGSGRLAELLQQPLQSGTEIGNYQQAIRVLSGQADKRQLLTAHGLLTGEKEGNLHGLASWLSTGSRLFRKKWLRIARWILIGYNIGGILFYLATDNYLPLLAGVLASWGLTGYFLSYISGQHALIGKKQAILDQYATILRIFSTMESGDADLLQQLRLRSGSAHRAIRRLSRLSSFFDQRLNVLVNIFLNSFLLYDLQCMLALEKWKEIHRSEFPGWVDAVGAIECLNSLASFAFNNPGYCYPSAVDSTIPAPAGTPLAPGNGLPSSAESTPPNSSGTPLFLRGESMAHPLIPASERIPNDFTVGDIGAHDRFILVTGSNMSGKTTFLRTVGVNLLLAQCGAPVCAASFSFTPMQILTSLRVSDSLQEHTSYFMAELKKLQRIIHRLQSGLPALVLIDEILRGTNSEDKTYGSEQFILRLLRYNCLSIFATHDLSLGKLENEKTGLISNYCFESIIQQGELHFNYLLQKGIARNRNASFLMKKMEII